MFVKADLHIHTADDPYDSLEVTAREIIDKAAELGFKVLSFTCHDFYSDSVHFAEAFRYARSKGILLISGGEKKIQRCDVLIYNVSQSRFNELYTFEDLIRLKDDFPDSLISAPHPAGPTASLNGNLNHYHTSFDAVEETYFWCKHFDGMNTFARTFAKQYRKTLLAFSDTHNLSNFGKNYTEIDLNKNEFNTLGVIGAIKEGRVRITNPPLTSLQILQELARMTGVARKMIMNRTFCKRYAQNPPPFKR